MTYQIIAAGDSHSFPDKHAFIHQADSKGSSLVYLGQEAAEAFANSVFDHEKAAFIAIELGNECLGVHIDDDNGPQNVLGFARFRVGDDAPTKLVELVRKPYTSDQALAAARALL